MKLIFSENMEEDKPIQDMKGSYEKHMEERDMEISWQKQNPKLTINDEHVSLQTDTIDEINQEVKEEKEKSIMG